MSTFTLGIVFLAYFIILTYLGWLGYKNTKSSEDYLIGGRGMGSVIMSLSYGATFISASAIVGFGGVSATFGMGIQWLCFLNMFVGVVIAFIIFGKRTRSIGVQLGASSFPQFLGKFYKSKHIRIFVAAIIILGMPLYAAVVLKGGAVFIEQIFSVDYNIALLIFTLVISAYVITGGMKGVMYTDALQAIIMFLCMAFLLVWFYKELGVGFTEGNRQLGELSSMIPEGLKAQGHQGWTAMPTWNSPQWWTLVTSLILGVGIGCLAQPQLVVRFMTVKSNRQLNRGVLIGCVFLLVTVGVIYHVGAMSNLYFMKTEGIITLDLVNDIDKIIPYFINHAMPDWFTAVFMMCIISAGMSTLSSQFHTMGVAVGADIYPLFGCSRRAAIKNNEIKDDTQEKASTKVVRIAVLISILASYGVCYLLSANVIARGTSIFMGICAATFLPAYFCALYWKKVSRAAAIASMWVGALSSTFALLFLHEKESAALGICQFVFGCDCLFPNFPLTMVDPIVWSFPLACITIFIVTLIAPNKSQE